MRDISITAYIFVLYDTQLILVKLLIENDFVYYFFRFTKNFHKSDIDILEKVSVQINFVLKSVLNFYDLSDFYQRERKKR